MRRSLVSAMLITVLFRSTSTSVCDPSPLPFLVSHYQSYSQSLSSPSNNLFSSLEYYPKSYDYSHIDYIQNIYNNLPIQYNQKKVVSILFDIYERNILSYVNAISELFQETNQTEVIIDLIPFQNVNINNQTSVNSYMNDESVRRMFPYTNRYNNILDPADVKTELLQHYYCSLRAIPNSLLRWIFTVCLLKKGLVSTVKVSQCLKVIELEIEPFSGCVLTVDTIQNMRSLIHLRNRLFYSTNDLYYQAIHERTPLLSIDGHVFPLTKNDHLLLLCDYLHPTSLHYCSQGKRFSVGIPKAQTNLNLFDINTFEENRRKPRVDIYMDPSCKESSKFISIDLNLMMRKQ